MAPASPQPPVGRREEADERGAVGVLLCVVDDGLEVERELLGGEASTSVAHLQAPELGDETKKDRPPATTAAPAINRAAPAVAGNR